jgi:hypothetical protein
MPENWVIPAGLKNMALMSWPPALTPAKALPWELGLCSRSWKPEAWATGAKAPAATRAKAVRVRLERWLIGA